MLLETEQLTKCYGAFRALDELNLQIGQGEIFGLLGPNGSGKSTTIRLLLGFLKPTSGRAAIAGYDCWRQSVQVRRNVAYLPGELRLYENVTGLQLLKFLSDLHEQPLDERGFQMARRFDLDLKRPIAHLSSGMKRKLALLQVLLPKVPLLILDEPTNTLDPTMRDELLDQLVAAKGRGQTVLFSSHVLHEVERVCDRVAILRKGRLAHLQPMEQLRSARQVSFRLPSSNNLELPTTWASQGVATMVQNNGKVVLECRGEMQPVLQWLAAREVADLRIEPLGLGMIYQQHHGTEQ